MRLGRQIELAVWVSAFIIAACAIAWARERVAPVRANLFSPKYTLPAPIFESDLGEGIHLTLYSGAEIDRHGAVEGWGWSNSVGAVTGDSCQSRLSCTMSSYKSCAMGGSVTVAIIVDREERSTTCLVKCNRSDDPIVTKCYEECDPCVATSWNCQGPCLEPEPTPDPCPDPEQCAALAPLVPVIDDPSVWP